MGSQHKTGFLHVIAQITGAGVRGRMNFTEKELEHHILENGWRISLTNYSKNSTEVLQSVHTEKNRTFRDIRFCSKVQKMWKSNMVVP